MNSPDKTCGQSFANVTLGNENNWCPGADTHVLYEEEGKKLQFHESLQAE